MKIITLAGGCFWGVEAYFSRMKGVLSTTVGYANGFVENPTYEMVCTGTTGHAEAVKISYDPAVITLETILDAYWSVIDPTTLNKQGPDTGTQYRTGIYFDDFSDMDIIEKSYLKEQKKHETQMVTEVMPLDYFSEAESYHQAYLKKNPGGYCHIKLD